MSNDIKVPDIGDFTDVPVIEIFVKPGDTVKAEDPLVSLESDKATMDVPAPRGGMVKSIAVKVGDKVSEGSVLMVFEGDAAERRGHVHRRLVGLERDERVFGLHRIARFHLHLDDGHVLEVADVGDLDLDCLAHRVVLRHTVQGAGSSASSPYLAIASATTLGLIAPSSASAFSAATATCHRSTSKKRRSFLR